jgi:hypothetical protein
MHQLINSQILSSNDPCCIYFAPLPLDVTNFNKATTKERNCSVLGEDRHKKQPWNANFPHKFTRNYNVVLILWTALEGSTNALHSCTKQKTCTEILVFDNAPSLPEFRAICANGGGGYAVAQLVEALRYNPEGRGFDSRWCHWNI